MPSRMTAAFVILFAVAYVLPLGVRPLYIPDEVRYAEVPREMRATGDFVVPHVNGLRYFEKPVLGYWLIAGSMWMFGEGNFAARLPSVVATAAAALAVFFLVRRVSGPAAAVLSAAVLLSSALFYAVGTFSVLDMHLTAFLTGAMVFFFFAYRSDSLRQRALYLALVGVCMGGAFLVKGFLAFAVPCVAIVPFLIWERRTGRLLRLAWIPVGCAIVIAAPWAILIHLREPDFWHHFFWQEHVRRFLSPHAQHPEAPWYFVPVAIAGLVPWVALAPAAVMGLRRGALRDPLVRFALCWAILPFLFFSASRGKLPTYILPCFPPLAILIAVGLLQYDRAERRRAILTGARALAVFFGTLSLAVVVWWASGLDSFPYGRGEGWALAVALAMLAAWAAVLWFSGRRRSLAGRLAPFCVMPLLLAFLGAAAVPSSIERRFAPGDFIERNAHRIEPGELVFAHKRVVQAICWHLKTTDVRLYGRPGELEYGLQFAAADRQLPGAKRLARLLSESPSATTVTLIEDADHYREDAPRLPAPVYEDSDGVYVFAQYRAGDSLADIPGPTER